MCLRDGMYGMQKKIPRSDRQQKESMHILMIGGGKISDVHCTDNAQLYHNGGGFRVEVKILKNCFGDLTTRRISEAVLIDELSANETMNAKSEWTYDKLICSLMKRKKTFRLQKI